MGGNRAGADVKCGRRKFSGDLVHVGDHQQQTLGGGEGGGQRSRLQSSVDRTGSSAFALHFNHMGYAAPDVR